MSSPVLTVDIGNSRIHWAVYADEKVVSSGDLSLRSGSADFTELLSGSGRSAPAGVIACSVSPPMEESLRAQADRQGIPCVFLTWENVGIPLGYHHPTEIGPDRLASALGARLHSDLPCVIVDMGTAVTVDAITRANGYEGGVIAPGLAMLSDYLHEKTALLPKIDLGQASRQGGIGRSTVRAMEIGCVRGFEGMIAELIRDVCEEVEEIDRNSPSVLVTGGSYQWVSDGPIGEFPFYPLLALEGLRSKAHELLQPLWGDS